MKNIDWTDLQYFLAIAETGTLAAAANQVEASPATVWRRIRSLQKSLGVSLFEETSSGHVLSAAGLDLMAAVGEMEHSLSETLQRLTQTPVDLHGLVRVTAPEFVGSELIAPHLPDLLSRHPHLTLELLLGSPSSTLADRQTDIGILPEPVTPPRFQVYDTFVVPFGLYASPSYLEKFGRPASIHDLGGHCLVDFEDATGHVAPARWMQRDRCHPTLTFRSSSPHARAAAVQAGVGLGLFPCCFAQRGRSLVCVIPPDEMGELTFAIWVNANGVKDVRVKAIASLLSAWLHEEG